MGSCVPDLHKMAHLPNNPTQIKNVSATCARLHTPACKTMPSPRRLPAHSFLLVPSQPRVQSTLGLGSTVTNTPCLAASLFTFAEEEGSCVSEEEGPLQGASKQPCRGGSAGGLQPGEQLAEWWLWQGGWCAGWNPGTQPSQPAWPAHSTDCTRISDPKP